MTLRCREKDLNGRETVPLFYCMFSIEVFLGFLRPHRTLRGRGVERIEIIDLESSPKKIPICGTDLPKGSARTENFHGGEKRDSWNFCPHDWEKTQNYFQPTLWRLPIVSGNRWIAIRWILIDE